jgi:hypothetical protein
MLYNLGKVNYLQESLSATSISPRPFRNVILFIKLGARGGVVVKALRYKPTGRGFDSRWCHWNFSVI